MRAPTTAVHLLFPLLILVVAAQAPANPPYPHPFGMTLTPGAVRLWNEVAKAYGKPILTEKTTDPTDSAFSTVADDGTAVVQLADNAHDEDHLVHELMHLKFIRKGFPLVIDWDPICNNDIGRLRQYGDALKESIDHWIFYPRVRAMGMTPDESYVNILRRAVKTRNASSVPGAQLALDYFRVRTMADQQALAESIKAWGLVSHRSEAIEVGEQMSNVLTDEHPTTPYEEMRTFVACATILFKGQRNFEFTGWETKLRGRVRVQLARVRVETPVGCQ